MGRSSAQGRSPPCVSLEQRERDRPQSARKVKLTETLLARPRHCAHHRTRGTDKSEFKGQPAAFKLFRNTEEDKAFREIEIMFALRHPNVIGLYAWTRDEGLGQLGILVELADGDLEALYKEKEGRPFSLLLGMEIVLGAAKGLAHMHLMPKPVVHRDVKSGNIMAVSVERGTAAEASAPSELVGKMGDCGESRRIDLNSTMTRTGSPLWAAVRFALCWISLPRLDANATIRFLARAPFGQAIQRGRRHVFSGRRAVRDCGEEAPVREGKNL